jgi:plasmid stabilization system protein ParE
VTLPVVWIPDANKDLLEARAWYDNIRPQLGERFALAVEATVEAIAEHPSQFPVVYRNRSPFGSAPLSVRNILRSSGEPDCGHRLLPRQTQSEALAVAVKRSDVACTLL